MGILTTMEHEFWATVSGKTIEEVQSQQAATWKWGVVAVELRADLMSAESYAQALDRRSEWRGPTFVAHFGIGNQAEAAYRAAEQAIEAGADGAICHSRCELAKDIRRICKENGKHFAGAYHSQYPISASDAIREFERQEELDPLFRKIAARAESFEDALALLEATRHSSQDGGTPVVGAVFGKHRWARVAMPQAGSAISFVIAHQVSNEVGGDDEQLTIHDADLLQQIRSVYPTSRRAATVTARQSAITAA
jgi:3-dehydroquinate dehydratase